MAPPVARLSQRQLVGLRGVLLEEAGRCLLAGQRDREELANVIARVDARLAKLNERDEPATIERRLAIASEKRPTALNAR